MKKQYNAIDLFSGCGGLTEGLKQAGFTVIGAVEIEPLAVETYQLNHKKTHVWQQDIRTLSGEEICRVLNIKVGELDLLAGCPPCQGFSMIRTLNGKREIHDDRKDLVFEFVRLVKELHPKAIMMENVPGLKSDTRMEIVVQELKKLGYKFNDKSIQVLNVAHYGVPQRRRRMILMAAKKSLIPFAEPLKSVKTVRDTIAALPRAGQSGDPLHDIREKRTPAVQAIIEQIPKNGGARRNMGEEFQLRCHQGHKGFKDVYARMWWDSPAPTITGGCVNPSKGRFLHPEENRAITLREAALLQSFPPTYQFSMRRGKDSVALMIGNALPPEFIRRQAAMIQYFFHSQEL